MCPTGCTSPKFYGLPKIHKNWHPLRPIVLSRGSVTYGVAKILANILRPLVGKSLHHILRPLVGKSLHHIQSTKDFVNMVSKATLLPGECLYSYDVTTLFTSVPIDPALNIIRELLEEDTTLLERTVSLVQNIIELLGFCLHNTYFSFQNNFYEQVEGAAMGSPASLIVVNLYMDYFEKKALHTASTPSHWFRFVDDTFVIQQESHKHYFLEHINNIDPAIKFTVEGNQENGTIPFLDTLVKQEVDNFLSISVYRKPTHTDQFLQLDSNHNLAVKYSVIGTLTHRAKTLCTVPELLNKEI